MYSIADSHQYLRKFSIKPSVQRTAVMDFLLNNRIHPTIDEIYLALSPSMTTLSKTTVYNTLDLFLERGAVQSLVIDEKNSRYDVDISAHAHFICKSCGAVHDIFDLSPEYFKLPKNSNFSIHAVEISYSGICNQCKGN
jgi:Fur family ferric uptake transcriptional regulator/Fur family peroxide stress response transcriptional regulator